MGVMVDIDAAKRAALRADAERRVNETMHRLSSMFASELDHDRLVALIVDELTKVVEAEAGEFREGADASLAEATRGSSLVVPVISRSGEVFGRLRFEHHSPGRFTDEHERLVTSVARQAAIALENARLYKSVREHKEALEHAVEQAHAADRRKNEFLAMLGHELRNPLAPIATALDLMEMKGETTLVRERDVIRRQVTHLTRLIDDLLDVARITRGKISLARETVELAMVLARASEMVGPLLGKRKQRLDIQQPTESVLVDADATRLAQVFQNLLTNASKYSDPGATIRVVATVHEDTVVIDVHDRGIGIPADLLPHLFDLFVQGERTLDRSEGGLGIGLTIARSLVELHGGAIRVESGGAGQGSTFSVTLPRSMRARVSTDRIHALPHPRATPTGARVLVVDDNIDAALMLRELLTALGHTLEVAHDGASALQVAATFEPDIAVLDIGLPVMNGYELARRLRERLGPERLRLIALSGYGQEADRARAKAVGFDHHLIKPVDIDALLNLLQK
jgi:signal transduction histidine kinase